MVLHGDVSSNDLLIEEQRRRRESAAHGGVHEPLTDGGMLFPELSGQSRAWLEPDDGSSPEEYTRRALQRICSNMVGPTDLTEAVGPIPAAYTYFGQFVFHDMVFSRIFGLPKGAGGGYHLRNAASLGLDLSGLYGRGPEADGHLYDRPGADGGIEGLFPVGLPCIKDQEGNRIPACAGRDLPRLDMSGRFVKVRGRREPYHPLVGDPRNDDNLILSQLQATLMAIHNRLVDVQNGAGKAYDRARTFLISSYRNVVKYDYMRRVLARNVWEHFFGDGAEPDCRAGKLSGLPLEFTFGASRFAHSMVRQFYTVNDSFEGQDHGRRLEKLLSFSSLRPDGNVPIEANWVVDWKRLVGEDDQRARRISPFLVSALSSSRLTTNLEDNPRPVSFMDNWHCYELGLPSGQEIAGLLAGELGRSGIDVKVLSPGEILPTAACAARFSYNARKLKEAIEAAPGFEKKTPLSYYILQEASVHGEDGSHLGPVGSYIVGATVAAALYSTSDTNFPRSRKAPVRIDTLAALLALETVTPDGDLIDMLHRPAQSQEEVA